MVVLQLVIPAWRTLNPYASWHRLARSMPTAFLVQALALAGHVATKGAIRSGMMGPKKSVACRMGFEDTRDDLNEAEKAAVRAAGGYFAGTYGEITSSGFSSLGKRLSLGPDDVFVDCGSGESRAVIQAVREFDVRQAFGIEIVESRHRQAEASLEGDEVASRVCLLQADCADISLWAPGSKLSGCTCAYTANVVFDAALNTRLKRCFEACDSLRAVAAFVPFEDGLAGFGEPSMVGCDATWSSSSGSPVYVYERKPSWLPDGPTWLTGEMEGALVVLGLALLYGFLGPQ